MLLAKFFDSSESVINFLEESRAAETASIKAYEISSGQVLLTGSVDSNDAESGPQIIGGDDWFRLNVRKKRFFTINGLNAYLKAHDQPRNAQVDWDSIEPHTILISNRRQEHICYSLSEIDLTSKPSN